MQTLEVTKSNALKAFDNADQKGKALLTNLFGEAAFSRNIVDRVKTFEDACGILGVDPNSDRFNEGLNDEIAYMKLKIIAAALNENWIPDWNDDNQKKWYPWFYMNKPGFRFYVSHYVCTYTFTSGGSRLCFKSQELSDYTAKQFLDLYRDFFTN